MNQTLHRGIATSAATALVGAGLLATTPASPIPLPTPPVQHVQHVDVQLTDVFGALATNVDNFFTDTWGALTSLGGLHLGQAVGDVAGSWENLLYMPENLIISGLATLTGETSPPFLDDAANMLSGNVLGQLWTEFTVGIPSGLEFAVSNLFSFHLADAYSAVTQVFDTLVLTTPAEIIGGTLMSLGL